jgi:hypothetical protein
MLRDGLNLYGVSTQLSSNPRSALTECTQAIWVVNMVNMLFWFIIKPTGPEDPIRTIVTSMAAVLTTSMTLRIVLSVRGTLVKGGTFHGAHSSAHSGSGSGSRSTHVISTPRTGTAPPQLSTGARGQTYTLDVGKETSQWVDAPEADGKSSVRDKDDIYAIPQGPEDNQGVKITVNTEVDYDSIHRR